MYVFIFLVKVTEWPPIGKIAAHSAYEMFSWYKYLIVSLVFSHLGFWSGSLFLIAPFLDLCLLVPSKKVKVDIAQEMSELEKKSNSKTGIGEKLSGIYTKKTYRKPIAQRSLSYPNVTKI